MIRCEVWPDGNDHHLDQVYTGLAELHEKGVIRLIQRLSRPSPNKAARWTAVKAVLNGTTVVYYDLFDGAAINREALEESDYYFKRSCSREAMKTDGRVFPLGLNYCVVSRRFDVFRLRRVLAFGSLQTRIRNTMKTLSGYTFPTVREFGAPPDFNRVPRVALMTRVYDSGRGGVAQRESIERLNWTRVRVVNLLRREFGRQFYGGIRPDPYAVEKFKDAVFLDKRAFYKRAYFAVLRACPICVATRGLWRSIGGKFGEYVSLAKAIVTEPLDYEVPGDLESGRNYLEFATPEQCVEAVSRLFADQRLRAELMMNNYRYYHRYVRPDKLVLNTLLTALASGPAP